MAQWIEVKARYDKPQDNGSTKRVTEAYLVDALSCPEAEARVIAELWTVTEAGCDLSVKSNKVTNISEVINLDTDEEGTKNYRVKCNFIEIDPQSGRERRQATYYIVRAAAFVEAQSAFVAYMMLTIADWEIEAIAQTRYVDIFGAKTE